MMEQRRGTGPGHGRSVQRSAVHNVLRSAGKPLDEGLRTEMETRFGSVDFSDVRVHADGAARHSASEINARAYTSGSHIVMGEGGTDKHTLAHALPHVVQQRSGPVTGTDSGAGLKVSDPADQFERAAEENAARVMRAPVPTQAGNTTPTSDDGSRTAADGPAVQRTYRGPRPTHGPLHQGAGTCMHAELHPGQLPKGSGTVSTVKPPWWPAAGTPTGDWFPSTMVQGHLLNVAQDIDANYATKIPAST